MPSKYKYLNKNITKDTNTNYFSSCIVCGLRFLGLVTQEKEKTRPIVKRTSEAEGDAEEVMVEARSKELVKAETTITTEEVDSGASELA